MIKSNKILTIGIFIVLVLSLSFFAGCTEQEKNTDTNDNPDSPTTGSVVATVNGEEITSDEVTDFVQQQQGQISEENALEQLIIQTLLSQKAAQNGYNLTDEEVETELQNQLAGQNQTLQEYKQYLQQQGYTYEEILQNYKEQLTRQNYLDDAIENQGINVTDEEAESDLEENLLQQNQTLQEYKQYLQQQGYPYEQLLQNYKQQLKQQIFIQSLREQANIQYYD